jgi:ribosomal protein S18 acetylase RimI-like enzyme
MVEYQLNKASEVEIAEHLARCDADFIPPLSGRIEIKSYAKKIVSKAMRFEAWSGTMLVGLVAVYCNDQVNRVAYITSVSVLREWLQNGIATRLMAQCITHAKVLEMRQISLEVGEKNFGAIKLYEKNGFIPGKLNTPLVTMNLLLNGAVHEQ